MNWLSDGQYAKLKSNMERRLILELRMNYPMHGYLELAPGVAKQLMYYVEESWDIIRGRDKPLPDPGKIGRWGNL